VLRSANTRPRLSLTLKMPCLGARAMLNPSSTPRKIAMRPQPSIGVKIPGRNQEQAHTVAAVFPAQSGKIHIFADGDAPKTAGLLQRGSRIPYRKFARSQQPHGDPLSFLRRMQTPLPEAEDRQKKNRDAHCQHAFFAAAAVSRTKCCQRRSEQHQAKADSPDAGQRGKLQYRKEIHLGITQIAKRAVNGDHRQHIFNGNPERCEAYGSCCWFSASHPSAKQKHA
jgi:hypothetical protein